MPWYVLVYLIAFLAISVAADVSSLQIARSRSRWLADCVFALALGTLFAAHWHLPIRSFLGIAAMPLYLGAMAWEVASSPSDIRTVMADAELPFLARICFVALPVLLFLPLYVIAGIVAFGSYRAA